jgi:hypothetical protein
LEGHSSTASICSGSNLNLGSGSSKEGKSMSDFITPEDEDEIAALEALWRETIISMEKEMNDASIETGD